MASIPGITVQPVLRGVNAASDVIRPNVIHLADTRSTSGIDEEGSAWTADLFVWPGQPAEPVWLAFLRDGFGADVTVPDTTRSRAVVIMTIEWRGAKRLYAVAFGDGRHQLKRSTLDLAAARKVQLNVIYAGDSDVDDLERAPRIRDIEYVERGETTMRTRRQAGRNADFDQFSFDPSIDQLVGVTGAPADTEAFGRRISGRSSLRLARRVDFDAVAGICRNLARHEERDHYRRRFDFVDRVTEITDVPTIAHLDQQLGDVLEANPDDWDFAPPELVDFDRLAAVRLGHPDIDLLNVGPTPEISEMLAALGAAGLDEPHRRLAEIRVEGVGPNPELVGSWTLRECLDGQFRDDNDATVLLSAGRYSSVDADFINQVDQQLALIQRSAVDLPNSKKVNGTELTEGEYNKLAADSSSGFLLMDRRSVAIPGRTSPVEVCDVLTTDRQLVHVKRKFAAGALSHLFSQGETSGVLLLDAPEFRAAVRHKLAGDPAQFRQLFNDGFVAVNFEIVYAIVGDWRGGGLVERLSFFSKVNLVRRARQLRRSGYTVTYSAVGIDPA